MNDELFLKYLNRQCSEVELAEIDAWIRQHPKNAEQLFESEHLWSLRDELRFSDSDQVSAAYTRFSNRITELAGTPSQTKSLSTRKKKSSLVAFMQVRVVRRILSYAAVVIVALSVGFNLYLYNDIQNDFNNDNLVEVPAGQSIALTLSDGTKVWLNAESSLKYPARFSGRGRKVELKGEGYFEVTHNNKSPFTVHMSELDVQVLGTCFNARSYAGEPNTTVTLSQGRVLVSSPNGKSLELEPNQQAVYSKEKGLYKQHVESAQVVHSWIAGELIFTDQPLGEIVRTLERHFGANIVIRDPDLTEELFTCHTQPATSLFEVLNLLRSAGDLDYKITDRCVILFHNSK